MGVAGLTGESFDDGQADIPAGVAGPVERVVVIGAGIAGLTVANALTHGGIECVVVEAPRSDRRPAAHGPTSPRGQTQPTPMCWASRSAAACCLPESTPRARGWLTPTAR